MLKHAAWFLPFALAAQSPAFRWNGQLAPGQTVEIRGIHGSIAAEPGTSLEVTATKRRQKGDPEAVRIVATPGPNGIVICALYPDRNGAQRQDCNDQRQINSDNNTVVEFQARIPAGLHARLSTVHGDVRARGLTADAWFNTVHGSIQGEAGRLRAANTVHGAIDVRTAKVAEEAVRVNSVHGDVRLRVDSAVNADFEASTLHGRIHSDLPVSANGVDRHSLRGKLGNGGPRLQLATVHGDVNLSR